MTAESDTMGGPVATGTRSGHPAGHTGAAPGLTSRAPAFVRASRPLRLAWRGGVFVVGLAVVVCGIVLLPLPGPGWLVIFGGMAVWSTEFAWAHRILRWTRRKVGDLTRAARRRVRVRRSGPRQDPRGR
jgi:uncharacterized protein (TIGR02611 family)